MWWFRDLNPILKVALILTCAAVPFLLFVLTRAEPNTEPLDEAMVPFSSESPDTPLVFPFGTVTSSVTTSTEPVSSTTPTSRPRTTQCSDGRDNDRDGRVDLRDSGCRSRSDNSEFNTVATTRPRTTTRPPATTTTRPPSPQPSPTPSRQSPRPSPRPSPPPSPTTPTSQATTNSTTPTTQATTTEPTTEPPTTQATTEPTTTP